MTAKKRGEKLVLVADMVVVEPERETHKTPWGKVWTRGADVMATWRRHGFVPPTEYRSDYLFKVNREGGAKP
jgi:hypothetical protein